jgi:hypothetical protein
MEAFTNEHIGSFAPDLVGNTADELRIFINDTYNLAKMDIETI